MFIRGRTKPAFSHPSTAQPFSNDRFHTAKLLCLCDLIQQPGFVDVISNCPEWSQLRDVAGATQVTTEAVVHGRGLVANRPLEKGEVVALYPVHALGLSDWAEADSSLGAQRYADRFHPQRELLSGELLSSVKAIAPGPILGSSEMLYFEHEDYYFGPHHGSNDFSFSIEDPSEQYTFDVNPNRPCLQGSNSLFGGHIINDASCVDFTGEPRLRASKAASYCESSILTDSNVVMCPFGPAPLMAYVTTRQVAKGEELLGVYGLGYWLSYATEDQEEAELIRKDVISAPGVSEKLGYCGEVLEAKVHEAEVGLERRYGLAISKLKEIFSTGLAMPKR